MINKFRYRKPQQQQQANKDNKVASVNCDAIVKEDGGGVLGAKEKKRLKVSWLCNCLLVEQRSV